MCVDPPGTYELYVSCLRQLRDGRLVSGSDNDDCSVKMWDTISGACLNTIPGHTGEIKEVIELIDEESYQEIALCN